MITKDLGIATAYGYALSKGYTGTEEEFAELMASYASTAQTAVEAAERAVAAQGAAELAQGKAEDAQGVAEGKATEASGSADSASADALKAEGLAVGQQNGTDVGSGSPYYHANAKYYKEQAAGSATTASTKAGEAAQSATDASNAKTAAQTAKGKAEDAQTAAETAQGKAEDAQEAAEAAAEQAEQTLNSYAHVDGYYEEMSVGNAEQLIANIGVQDNAPYLFRTSGGAADIGNREDDSLVGGSIAWNQMLSASNKLLSPYPKHGLTFTPVSGDKYGYSVTGTFNPTSGDRNAYVFNPKSGDVFVAGHKYLILNTSKYFCAYVYGNGTPSAVVSGNVLNVDNQNGVILNCTTAGGFLISAHMGTNIAENTAITETFYFNLFDLTQMFGATIADFIYGLEQATSGSGVAWFKKYFAKPYYAYDSGSIQSVQAAAHKTVGFNAWDEQYEDGYYDILNNGAKVSSSSWKRCKNLIPCVPQTNYYFYTDYSGSDSFGALIFYDANGNMISSKSTQVFVINAVSTTPENCHYMAFYAKPSWFNSNICINLHWDGERDGEYEAYDAHTYELDSDLVLRGIPKLDTNNNLYYDGDTYKSDGTVVRKYGIVTFDGSNDELIYVSTVGTTITRVSVSYTGAKYPNAQQMSTYLPFLVDFNSETEHFYVNATNVLLYILSSKCGTTAESVRTYLSSNPITIVYELETPTTEQADPFTNPQVVDDFGTEEYTEWGTRDVAIPVGHNTTYQANLKAKLEMSPDSPTENGDHVVRKTNDGNAYIPWESSEIGEKFAEVEAEIAAKANSDGYYEQMTVGNAEQLVSTVTVEDKVPYLFRTSGGSADIGDREVDMVVGGTVAWNQLFRPFSTAGGTGWGLAGGTKSVTNEVFTYTVAEIGTYGYQNRVYCSFAFAVGHRYLICVKYKPKYDGSITVWGVIPNNASIDVYGCTANVWNDVHVIFNGNGQSTLQFAFNLQNLGYEENDELYLKEPVAFDLTQMFGSTIADYIYSLEQATPGAGVAFFRKLFSKPYYAYNPGELMSVQAAAHKLVGFNALKESAGYVDGYTPTFDTDNAVHVIKGMNYEYCHDGISGATSWRNAITCYDLSGVKITGQSDCISVTSGIMSYNGAGNYFVDISNSTNKSVKFTANFDGYIIPYFLLGDTSASCHAVDPCVHLSWDGERDGEYEPYTVHSYALDSDIVLRGIPKMDANNALYYDGDTYESDGTVTRRYGTITFDGTESWTKYETGGHTTFNRVVAGMKLYGYGIMGKKYSYDSATIINFQGEMTWISFGKATGTLISIKDDSYSDEETFAASMAGVSFVYELATPTTETADPYQNPQIVDDFGTEEYVDAAATAESNPRDVAIPVGHVTEYQSNLRAKLEMSPESPSGDGDYIVRQTNGQNAYVPMQFPADELPAPPTSNGNYMLKCAVSGGTATYTWESIT